jgi:DNA-binding GntR family transcriptional regulator
MSVARRSPLSPAPARSYSTKTELAWHDLRDRILCLDLPPGSGLAIDETARQLGVSPIPVREAIQLLAAEGLVATKAHTGGIVAPITRQSVVEVFTLLEGLETAVCRHAVAQATDAAVARIAALLDAFDEVKINQEPDRWAELNATFHLALAGLAGLPRVDAELRQAFDHWGRIRRRFFTSILAQHAEADEADHHRIVRALKAGNADRVEDLLRAHNRKALSRYLDLLPADSA